MDIGGEINKIFKEASLSPSPEVDTEKVQVLATDMLLDMQKLVSKNAEVITLLGETVIGLEDRVKVLEGKV